MYVDCRRCPLRETSSFRPLEGAELDFVRSIKFDQLLVTSGEEVVQAGDTDDRLYTLFSGWAIRYLNITDNARQILDILLPGDLIALQSPITGRVRHCVKAVTDVSLCLLDGASFRDLFACHPDLSEALVATLLFEENRADRRLAILGRLRPTFRLTYALLELRDRLTRRGMADGDAFDLTLTYELMSDLIGVSRAQLGASLKELRERDWARFSPGRVELLRIDQMTAASHYKLLPHPERRALI